MLCLTAGEPSEAESFDADRELLFEILFWQEQREIRKMTEADNLKIASNTEQT